MDSSLRLHDEVLQRFVQIIQEAMLFGVDCADIMRQVRLEVSEDGLTLVLTDSYKQMVEQHHQKMLSDAAELAQEISVDNVN